MKTTQQEILGDLYNDIQTTTTDRFNASKRLSVLDFHSITSISLASLSLIVVSVLLAMPEYSQQLEGIMVFINTIQIFLPIALLVVSVACGVANYGRQAEKMHSCGLELNFLRRDISNSLPVVRENSINEYKSRYARILEKYDNHVDADHRETKRSKAIKNSCCWLSKRIININSILTKFGFVIYFYLMLSLLSVVWTGFVIYKAV